MRSRFIFIGSIVLIIIIILVGIFTLLFKSRTGTVSNGVPSPTPIPLKYDQTQTDKMINTLKNRPSLPPSDADIKTNLINSVSNDSGTVQTTNDYRIDYIQSPDMFQVEILTTDIQKAKSEAVAWLKSKGMTQEGICKLPVTFYLNFDIKQQIEQSGTSVDFNPLPDGC